MRKIATGPTRFILVQYSLVIEFDKNVQGIPRELTLPVYLMEAGLRWAELTEDTNKQPGRPVAVAVKNGHYTLTQVEEQWVQKKRSEMEKKHGTPSGDGAPTQTKASAERTQRKKQPSKKRVTTSAPTSKTRPSTSSKARTKT